MQVMFKITRSQLYSKSNPYVRLLNNFFSYNWIPIPSPTPKELSVRRAPTISSHWHSLARICLPIGGLLGAVGDARLNHTIISACKNMIKGHHKPPIHLQNVFLIPLHAPPNKKANKIATPFKALFSTYFNTLLAPCYWNDKTAKETSIFPLLPCQVSEPQWKRSPGTWPLNSLGYRVRGPLWFCISSHLCGSTIMERSPTIRAALSELPFTAD